MWIVYLFFFVIMPGMWNWMKTEADGAGWRRKVSAFYTITHTHTYSNRHRLLGGGIIRTWSQTSRYMYVIMYNARWETVRSGRPQRQRARIRINDFDQQREASWDAL